MFLKEITTSKQKTLVVSCNKLDKPREFKNKRKHGFHTRHRQIYVTKPHPLHKNIGIELPLGQILKGFVASEPRTSLVNMAVLTKISNIGQK